MLASHHNLILAEENITNHLAVEVESSCLPEILAKRHNTIASQLYYFKYSLKNVPLPIE